MLILLWVWVVGSYGLLRFTPTSTVSQQFSSKSWVPSGIYQYSRAFNSDSTYNTWNNGRSSRTSWWRTYYSQWWGWWGWK